MTRALLMSSSRTGNLGYLEHAAEQLGTALDGTSRNVLFIPYAAVTFSFDEYEERVTPAFAGAGAQVTSIHHHQDPVRAVRDSDVIAIGGGNSFALLARLSTQGLVGVVREQVAKHGASYIGWSAGTNVATPTIRTTNDMPITQPPSFAAIGIVPFQINPHFISGKPSGHNGESREDRLAEFTAINPTEEVLALPEGTALSVADDHGTVVGDHSALVFSRDQPPRTIEPNHPFPLTEIAGPVR